MMGMQKAMQNNVEIPSPGAMLQIDFDEAKFSRIQKYILIVFLIVMGYSIAVLWKGQSDAWRQTGEIEKEFRTTIMTTINQNNLIMQENANALRELTDELKQGRTSPGVTPRR
jgi:hypothetical protein